jgi:uncharacterized membrane protein
MPKRIRPFHPALRKQEETRSGSLQNRVADAITRFSGSMLFIYIHVVWFILWISFRVEQFPFGLLTMIVSLEAIFLSTFVLISQNRADEKRQVMADHEWQLVQEEEKQNEDLLRLSEMATKQNEELLALSKQVLDLTRAIQLTVGTNPNPSRGVSP